MIVASCRVVTRGFNDVRFEIWDFHPPIVWTVPLAKPICTSRSACGRVTASPETRYVHNRLSVDTKKTVEAAFLFSSPSADSWLRCVILVILLAPSSHLFNINHPIRHHLFC